MRERRGLGLMWSRHHIPPRPRHHTWVLGPIQQLTTQFGPDPAHKIPVVPVTPQVPSMPLRDPLCVFEHGQCRCQRQHSPRGGEPGPAPCMSHHEFQGLVLRGTETLVAGVGPLGTHRVPLPYLFSIAEVPSAKDQLDAGSPAHQPVSWYPSPATGSGGPSRPGYTRNPHMLAKDLQIAHQSWVHIC